MADSVQDIVVSENYGRAKRASLLYGAALIILAMATPAGHSVSILGAAVPLDVAKVLTWLASFYYAINFWLEWRVARITNSKAMANEIGGGVNKRFEALTETFNNFNERIRETANSYVQALEGLAGNIDQIMKSAPATIAQSPTGFFSTTGDYSALFAKLDEANKSRIESFKMTVHTDRAIAERMAQENLSAYDAIGTSLTQLASDFHTLAGRFNTEQRIIFYGLDLGAVAVVFVVGTVISLLATWGIIHSCQLI